MKIRIAVMIISVFLLTMCASVNNRLITKTGEGDVPAMGKLIDKGADVNYREDNQKDKSYGQIPLTVAVKNQNLEAVKLLLARGADVNAEDRNGNSPLHLAVMGKNLDIAQLLVKSGADVDARNKNKSTPLYLALDCHNIDMAKLLVKSKADVNVKMGEVEGTILHSLVWANNLEGIKFVLGNGISVNASDMYGQNALHRVSSGAIAALLISKGANMNAKDKNGETPLVQYMSIPRLSGDYYGRIEAAIVLIQKGASLGVNDPDGKNMLHIAVTKGNYDLVEAIVEKKVNVNSKDKKGRTPLHYLYKAVVENYDSNRSEWSYDKSYLEESNSIKIGSLLKSRGARLDAEDAFGKTPSSFAFDYIMGEAEAGRIRSSNYRSRDAFDATGAMMALSSMGNMTKRRELLDKFEEELTGSSESESE